MVVVLLAAAFDHDCLFCRDKKRRSFGVLDFKFSWMVIGALLTICLADGPASGQSTILNVPSTETMSRNELYVEADLIAHASSFKKGGFVWYGPSVIYGMGRNVEIGVNAYVMKEAGPASFEIQPNVKWKVFDDESKGVSAAAGVLMFLPLKHWNETGAAAMFYAVVGKKVNKKFGPRFTTGAYGLAGRREWTKSRAGPMLGYEQPLGRRLTFMADWYCGRNQMGYGAAGFGLTMTKNSTLYATYNIGNEGRGNNWLGIYYGFVF